MCSCENSTEISFESTTLKPPQEIFFFNYVATDAPKQTNEVSDELLVPAAIGIRCRLCDSQITARSLTLHQSAPISVATSHQHLLRQKNEQRIVKNQLQNSSNKGLQCKNVKDCPTELYHLLSLAVA